jgi:hypothetical protein
MNKKKSLNKACDAERTVYSLSRDDLTYPARGRFQLITVMAMKVSDVIPCRLVETLLLYVGFLHRLFCFVCFDVSEETTTSIFSATELVKFGTELKIYRRF